ncbi:DUF6338 family protein [Geofilum sp. OHC36d9]|uniref:DUF6338 family protein n=1 Tax=Geofilum sp. OHC36d9 TaxID=3458413 RepID=UPI004034C0F2
MGDLTFDKILLLTIFFVPGFIYLKAYRLFIAETKTDFSKDFYEAIGFSFLNALIFSYPLFKIHNDNFIENNPVLYFIFLGLIILIAPIIAAFLFHLLSKKKIFSKYLITPTKSAWDSFFSKRESYYVIVTLKNDRKIGGKYGTNSYSSTYPIPKELYIEEVWELNKKDGFVKKIEQTEGMLITENEISTIEFFI